MYDIRILINYGGHWEKNIYKDGYLEMVFVLRNLTYEIVFIDPNICVYELRSLLNTNDNIAKFNIKNDRNQQYVLE